MAYKDSIFFCLWIATAGAVFVLGGQMMLFQPSWMEWFPLPVLAFLTVLVLPTLVLTLTSLRWFREDTVRAR